MNSTNQKIPEGWSVKKLGDIGKVSMCKRIMKHETNPNTGVPFYKIGTFGGKADAYISEALYIEYKNKYSYPKKGDILISAAGTIGRTVVFDGKDSYFQDSNIVWVANDEAKALNKYLLYYYTTSPWYTTTGGAISRLYNENISNAQILLPPLPEQEKIAGILGTWDEAIEKLSSLIEQKRNLKKGLMQRLLTGKTRLKGFTQPWKEVKLGELTKQKRIVIEKGKSLTSENIVEGDIPVIAGGKTSPYSHNKFTHNKTCITISASGAYAGYVWKHITPIWASDCNVLHGIDYDTNFLGSCLEYKQQQIYQLQTGGAQPHVYATDIKIITVPNIDITEQKAIADVLSTADEEINLLNKKLEALKEQKKGLMQQLLTGQTRVKVN